MLALKTQRKKTDKTCETTSVTPRQNDCTYLVELNSSDFTQLNQWVVCFTPSDNERQRDLRLTLDGFCYQRLSATELRQTIKQIRVPVTGSNEQVRTL